MVKITTKRIERRSRLENIQQGDIVTTSLGLAHEIKGNVIKKEQHGGAQFTEVVARGFCEGDIVIFTYYRVYASTYLISSSLIQKNRKQYQMYNRVLIGVGL